MFNFSSLFSRLNMTQKSALSCDKESTKRSYREITQRNRAKKLYPEMVHGDRTYRSSIGGSNVEIV